MDYAAADPEEIREDCEEEVDSPGKFEMEERYVPYFWQFASEGELVWSRPHLGESVTRLGVTDRDKEIFPELQDSEEIYLYESNHGFVSEISKEQGERFENREEEEGPFTGGSRAKDSEVDLEEA